MGSVAVGLKSNRQRKTHDKARFMGHAEKKTFLLSPSTSVRAEPVEDHMVLRIGSPQSAKAQRGYALLLMLVLVTMGVLFTLVSQLSAVGMKWGREYRTHAALLQAKEALIGYAATYRDTHPGEVFGYLPCPDADGDGNAETINNSTNCASSNQVVVGLLPYQTLGLSDLRDSSDECLWYAVSPGYKAGMSKVKPMNWDSRGQIRILANDGVTILVDPINGTEGGAAAVIFSAGPPLSNNTAGRGSNSSNVCGNNGKTNWRAFLESVSFDSTGNSGFDANGNSTANPLIVTSGTLDSISNNDQVAWITPKEIFSRIINRVDFKNTLNGSPAGQIDTLANETKVVIEKAMQDDLLATGSPTGNAQPINQNGYSQFSGKLIGDLPTLTLNNSSYQSYFDNWSDQFRYVVCSNLAAATPCLSIAGTTCRGALLFGGQSTSGAPRLSTQKPPVVLPAPPNAYLTNYFEAGSGLEILNSSNMSFSGQTMYSAPNNAVVRDPTIYSDPYNLPADRALDVGTCLFPGSFVSFAKDIGSFNPVVTSYQVALVNLTEKKITLGNNAGSASSASGCVWNTTSLAFATLLRAYFSFQITDLGEGFVFAIADADPARNPSTNMCGGQSSRLGYSGTFTGLTPINYPKIGLEIDTRYSLSQADPPLGENHIAFVYWGTALSNTDDNKHGAGTGGGTEPLNPSNLSAVPPGIATVKSSDTHLPYPGILPTSTTIHVRLDIDKSYNPTTQTATYTFKAYVVDDNYATQACSASDATTRLSYFQNLASPLARLCASSPISATIEQDNIPIDNVTTGQEALANVYVGFTNGQSTSSSSKQEITVSNFQIRSQ